MTKNDMQRMLSLVDEKYLHEIADELPEDFTGIEETYTAEEYKPRNRFRPWLAIAAAVCLCVPLGYFGLTMQRNVPEQVSELNPGEAVAEPLEYAREVEILADWMNAQPDTDTEGQTVISGTPEPAAETIEGQTFSDYLSLGSAEVRFRVQDAVPKIAHIWWKSGAALQIWRADYETEFSGGAYYDLPDYSVQLRFVSLNHQKDYARVYFTYNDCHYELCAAGMTNAQTASLIYRILEEAPTPESLWNQQKSSSDSITALTDWMDAQEGTPMPEEMTLMPSVDYVSSYIVPKEFSDYLLPGSGTIHYGTVDGVPEIVNVQWDDADVYLTTWNAILDLGFDPERCYELSDENFKQVYLNFSVLTSDPQNSYIHLCFCYGTCYYELAVNGKSHAEAAAIIYQILQEHPTPETLWNMQQMDLYEYQNIRFEDAADDVALFCYRNVPAMYTAGDLQLKTSPILEGWRSEETGLYREQCLTWVLCSDTDAGERERFAIFKLHPQRDAELLANVPKVNELQWEAVFPLGKESGELTHYHFQADYGNCILVVNADCTPLDLKNCLGYFSGTVSYWDESLTEDFAEDSTEVFADEETAPEEFTDIPDISANDTTVRKEHLTFAEANAIDYCTGFLPELYDVGDMHMYDYEHTLWGSGTYQDELVSMNFLSRDNHTLYAEFSAEGSGAHIHFSQYTDDLTIETLSQESYCTQGAGGVNQYCFHTQFDGCTLYCLANCTQEEMEIFLNALPK